tara:strand:+ start:3910 stop:4257 length:348 start_codon:yes stop_codon:yes gene_type:complete
MPKLTSALLNESIDIERYSSTSSLDDRGNLNNTWSSNATSVQARITEARDQSETQREFLEANRRRVRAIIPSSTDVTVRDRVVYESVKWDIVGVKNVKDRFGNSFYKQLILESGY